MKFLKVLLVVFGLIASFVVGAGVQQHEMVVAAAQRPIALLAVRNCGRPVGAIGITGDGVIHDVSSLPPPVLDAIAKTLPPAAAQIVEAGVDCDKTKI
jgi:hypothetical protein